MSHHDHPENESSPQSEHRSPAHGKHACGSCKEHTNPCKEAGNSCKDHEKPHHPHLSELLVKIDTLQHEVESFKEKYLRTYADLENYRKRMTREREEISQNAFINLMEDLLPIIDNFSMGLQSTKQPADNTAITSGFQIIYNQLESLLLNKGIERIAPTSDHVFNPIKHECVSHIPHDTIPEDHIVQTIRSGYQWKERLIRPATVVVSSGHSKSSKA